MFVHAIVVIGRFTANAFTANGRYIHVHVLSYQSCSVTANDFAANQAYIYLDVLAGLPVSVGAIGSQIKHMNVMFVSATVATSSFAVNDFKGKRNTHPL